MTCAASGGRGGRSNVTARSPSQSERSERVLTRCVRLGIHAFWIMGVDRQHPPTAGSVCPCALAIAPRGAVPLVAVALRALRAGCGLVAAAGDHATYVGECEFPWLAQHRMRFCRQLTRCVPLLSLSLSRSPRARSAAWIKHQTHTIPTQYPHNTTRRGKGSLVANSRKRDRPARFTARTQHGHSTDTARRDRPERDSSPPEARKEGREAIAGSAP